MKVGDTKVTVSLSDSMYILSSSLDTLAKKFDAGNKGYFPYTFVRGDNLYYEGEMPEYKHYNNLAFSEYERMAGEYKVGKK